MVQIDKNEASLIRGRFPYACIYRTVKKHSKRHHYFVSEEVPVMNFIAELRRQNSKILIQGESK